MMDQIDFVGSLLSLDCGETLGTFQGIVTEVNKELQSISLRKTYRNGVKYDIPEITIRAVDIQDLKILKSFDYHDDKHVEPTMSKSGQEYQQRNGLNTTKNSSSNSNSSSSSRPNSGQKTPKKHSGNSSRTPTKRTDGPSTNQNDSSGAQAAIYSGMQHSAFQRVQREEAGSPDDQQGGPDCKGRKQRTSGNFDPNQKVRSSPRKIDGQRQPSRRSHDVNAKNEECFSAPVTSYLADFDFEKSMRSFDKASIMEELAMAGAGDHHPMKTKNIPHDENIILQNVASFVHNKTDGMVKCSSYTSDCGEVIPAVSIDTIQRLFQAADKLGLSLERRLEAGGACLARMAVNLIGVRNSSHPADECPSILVVCGPHPQGAQGINCARHLANHHANVTLFIPNFAKMPDVVTTELRLFRETAGKHVTNVAELPEDAFHLIVNALDSPQDTSISKQPWYKSIVSWVMATKSSVLSIDPAPHPTVRSKWSVITGLPLSYSNTNTGMLYLCDVGIPSKVFHSIGVEYRSPFKDKSVVLLRNR